MDITTCGNNVNKFRGSKQVVKLSSEVYFSEGKRRYFATCVLYVTNSRDRKVTFFHLKQHVIIVILSHRHGATLFPFNLYCYIV